MEGDEVLLGVSDEEIDGVMEMVGLTGGDFVGETDDVALTEGWLLTEGEGVGGGRLFEGEFEGADDCVTEGETAPLEDTEIDGVFEGVTLRLIVAVRLDEMLMEAVGLAELLIEDVGVGELLKDGDAVTDGGGVTELVEEGDALMLSELVGLGVLLDETLIEDVAD